MALRTETEELPGMAEEDKLEVATRLAALIHARSLYPTNDELSDILTMAADQLSILQFFPQ